MTDEKSILEQFAAGNHTAFRELFMRYHLKVYYFVLGLVKSESDAEDLTQEIFLKLWTHRSRFTEVRTFGSYLYVLAKHTAFNYIESRRVNLVSLESASEEDEERSTPYEDLVAKDLRLLVDMIVETMPPQRRMIYRMSRNEGLSNTEISENLQLSKKTVEKHLNLALRELRNVVFSIIRSPGRWWIGYINDWRSRETNGKRKRFYGRSGMRSVFRRRINEARWLSPGWRIHWT